MGNFAIYWAVMMQSMQQDLRERDQAALRTEWAQLFDQSALEGLLRRYAAAGVAPGELIGIGTHFAAFRLGGSLKGLVLSVAKPEFLRQPRFKVEEWVRVVRKARGLRLPLMAPVEVLILEEGGTSLVGLVQLFGDAPKERAADHWGAVGPCIKQTLEGLAAEGVEIADTPQLRCRGSTPFIIDYSDFRASKR